MIKPEIMSPVKNLAGLEASRKYANAVYFSVSELSMRAGLKNITLANLNKFVKKCHEYKLKAYLALNCVLYNNDLPKAKKIITKAKQVGVDAVIVWDMAVIEMARQAKIPFFISTQANVSNWQTALFYKKLGAKRVVLARELTLKQIKELKKKVGNLEIETFVHGAMCYSISGRCLLSAYLYGASANCGACAQPCRKQYTLTDEDGRQIVTEGKYFMSAKDLCMIEHVPDLITAGIDSFKIEGRKRDPRYVAITARAYREAVDAYFNKTLTANKIIGWKKELESVYNRGFSTGFYFGAPNKNGISYDQADNLSKTKKVLLGQVEHYFSRLSVATIKFSHQGVKIGQEIIFEGNATFARQKIDSMQIDGRPVAKAGKGVLVAIKTVQPVKKGDRVFTLAD